MLIANPIYDVVFKRLMENDRVAKFFISTLLEETVESVTVRPQEYTYTTPDALGIQIFRLDFVAVIRAKDGGYRKILIEIQKARDRVDLMRFRNYLAEQYKKEDSVNGELQTLPITTIYILGFRLPEIESACIRVERQYKDLVTNATLAVKSRFVESLSHDSYIVQVLRIGKRYQSRLDKLLSLFEQRNFIDSNPTLKEYTYPVDEEPVKLATKILHHAGTDPEKRKELEAEQEAWRTVEALVGADRRKLENALEVIEEKEAALKAKTEQLEEQARLIEELRKKLDGEK